MSNITKVVSLTTFLTGGFLINNFGSYKINNNLKKNLIVNKSKNNLLSNDDTTIKRYDSLNDVDSKTFNDAYNNKLSQIQSMKDTVVSDSNGEKRSFKNALLDVYKDKNLLLNSDKGYTSFLSSSKNYKKNNLGISFPSNYNGVYFPWWGFGTYLYWYMSSNVVKKLDQYLGWGTPLTWASANVLIVGIASMTGVALSPVLMALLSLYVIEFAATWYMYKVSDCDDGNGIYVGLDIISPAISDYGAQDKCLYKKDSFEVDYRFCAPDYITVTLGEQEFNYILNWHDQDIYISNHSVNADDYFKNLKVLLDNTVTPYLKSLLQVDKTGAGGNIEGTDYYNWSLSFLNNDPIIDEQGYEQGYISKKYTDSHPNFNDVVLQTKRDTTINGWEGCSDYWKVWTQ